MNIFQKIESILKRLFKIERQIKEIEETDSSFTLSINENGHLIQTNNNN